MKIIFTMISIFLGTFGVKFDIVVNCHKAIFNEKYVGSTMYI